ncbi:sucrase ferredoxin [Nocardioides bizhenqiangii]|uniref:Sucrase ferredoxin n=1 Tax=Nocardioides bizhenqiangii TaxID=3095076 RepID=A0ABZ0ZSF4_9ACTN|nr:sucrase ferredoxin [Nocardioides sp. HM61]WQQ27030.1 sucrase ferredoxin [Nocardioides sp. HM61]
METAAAKRFSCAAASVLRDEPVAGTATHVRTWMLLEHSGPWGDDALLDARLPDGLGASLKQQAKTYRAKILLARRARAKRDPERLNVYVADAHPRLPRVEHGTVGDLREVLDLDLSSFREGGSAGLEPYDGALFCVCTNGRHDACCAEFGRPVAMALDDAHPEETWEVSHIGGDRFAGNLVVLPEGLYYGRLDPQRAIGVAGAHVAGELDLDHLRGRSSYPMPVQAAEHHLRRRVGATRIVDVELVRHTVDGDVNAATFVVGGATYAVRVRTVLDPASATRLTCKAHRDNPIPRHELLSVERTS